MDAVLFADVDVDLLPPDVSVESVRASWGSSLPKLVASGRSTSVRAVVSPDPASAINAGLLLLLPDASLYRDGLSVLRRGGFHGPERGWNGDGPPRELLGGRELRHWQSGRRVEYRGSAARIDNPRWDFVGADIDQGFLVYMLLARHDVARYTDAVSGLSRISCAMADAPCSTPGVYMRHLQIFGCRPKTFKSTITRRAVCTILWMQLASVLLSLS